MTDRVVVTHSDTTATATTGRGSVTGTAPSQADNMGLCASAADQDSPEVKKAAAVGAGGNKQASPNTPEKTVATTGTAAGTPVNNGGARRPSVTPTSGGGGLVAQAVAKAEDTPTKTSAPSPVSTGATGGGGLVAARLRAQAEKEAADAQAAAAASRRPTSTTRATTIGTPSPKCPICNQPGMYCCTFFPFCQLKTASNCIGIVFSELNSV
jgi:hypothetical protein